MSIKLKLIALLLFIGLVPTLVVGVVAYLTISRGITDNTNNQLISTSIKQEQQISSLLRDKQEEVVKLANRYEFQLALGKYLESKTPTNRMEIEALLKAKQTETPQIQTISVADPDGLIFASSVIAQVGQKMTSTETTITIREDSRDSIAKLYITIPLSVNKQDAGVMSFIFRIDDIIATVQDYTGLGRTGETMVAQENAKKEAISLFPLRFDTKAALTPALNSMQPFKTSGNAYTNEKDYRGNQVIVVSRLSVVANWVVITKIDADEALAPIVDLRNSLIGIGLFLSVAITIIAFYLSRLFTEPILRIAKVSRMIGTGDFTAHLEMQRKDEFGSLAQNINAMGSNLNNFVTSIESQRNRLEIILNSTEESILALDKQGIIIIANKATTSLTGMTIGDVVGKPMLGVFVWMRNGQAYDIDYNATGTQTYMDMQYTDHSGVLHYAEVVVAHIDDEHREAQTIITIHDQTKSRELENMKLDFVSMAAHELRTPLATIRGYLELVSFNSEQKDTTSKAPKVDSKQYIQQALKSTTDLSGLITNLLDVTKIERDALTLSMEKLDLAATVSQAVKDVTFSAQAKQQTMAYNGPEIDKFVAADPIPLREVINNLLSNAVKYTGPNGTIEVSMTEDDKGYTVLIKDSGIGIPEKALPNLFTKFYRVDSGLNSSSGGGTGLGLFLTKSIIERHGGTIGVESKEGEGSTFMFTIPMFNEEQFAVTEKEKSANIESTRRNHGWSTKNTDR